MRQKIRKILVDEVEFCWCSKEKDYHPCTNFGKMKHSVTGYHHYCKSCINLINSEKKIKIMDVQSFIKEQSNLMLSNLGYDTNSDIPIHEQFEKKHNL